MGIYYPSDSSLICHVRLPQNVFLYVNITHTKNLGKWPDPFFQRPRVSFVADPVCSAAPHPYETLSGQMDSTSPYLAPLSLGALWRYYLRQESRHGVIIPHVRICATQTLTRSFPRFFGFLLFSGYIYYKSAINNDVDKYSLIRRGVCC